MASQSTFSLPVVDFSQVVEAGMEPGTEAWGLVRSQIYEAVVEYGCFEAIYPKASQAERENVLSQLGELFALPTETKMKNNMEGKFIPGYLANLPSIPLYETLAIEDGDSLQSVDSFTSLMWPNGNQLFSETITLWVKKMEEFGEMVRRMILQSLDVEKYYDFHIQSTRYGYHAHHYKAPENGTTSAGLLPHTDAVMLTILLQSGVGGFELCTKNGEWHLTTPSPAGALLVIIGDAFKAWTNNILHSPLHRVTMCGEKERISFGLLAVPKRELPIKTPDELVDEEHPLVYKPYEHFEFIRFYANNPGKDALVDFAGISN